MKSQANTRQPNPSHPTITTKRNLTAISPSGLWKKRLGDWVINPYIGCEHGCRHCYCPAMPGVKFHNVGHQQEEWDSYLYPRLGIVSALARQLRSFTPDKARRTDWGDGWVLMSFLTDCYTPAEAKYQLTRQCLELLLDAGHKVRIQTRSALVERDFDLVSREEMTRVLAYRGKPIDLVGAYETAADAIRREPAAMRQLNNEAYFFPKNLPAAFNDPVRLLRSGICHLGTGITSAKSARIAWNGAQSKRSIARTKKIRTQASHGPRKRRRALVVPGSLFGQKRPA